MKKIKVDDELKTLIGMLPDGLEFSSKTEQCVCALMYYFANDASNVNGEFTMPINSLTNWLKIHRNTASVMVASLVKKGYFGVITKGNGITNKATVYTSYLCTDNKSICAPQNAYLCTDNKSICAPQNAYLCTDNKSICAPQNAYLCTDNKSICALNINNNINNNNKCNRKRNDNCKRNKKNKDNNKNNVSHKSYAVNATQQPTLNNYMKVEVKDNALNATPYTYENNNCINNSIIEDNAKEDCETLNATDNNNAFDTSIVNYFNDIENKGSKSAFEGITTQKVYSNTTDVEITAQNRSIEAVGNSAIDNDNTLNATDNNKDKNTTAMEIQDYQLEAIEDYINSKKGITYAKFIEWLQERVGKLSRTKALWQFEKYAPTLHNYADKYYIKISDKQSIPATVTLKLIHTSIDDVICQLRDKLTSAPDDFKMKLQEVKQAFNSASGAFLELKEKGNDVAEVFCNAFDMLVKVFTELEEANKDYEEFKQVAPYNPVNSTDFRINEMRAKFAELKNNKVA